MNPPNRAVFFYFFGLLCFAWSVFMTFQVIEMQAQLENVRYPYKEKYHLLSEVDLFWKVQETYDEMEKFNSKALNQNVWDYPRVFKYCMTIGGYIEEMKHRAVGDIALDPVRRTWLTDETNSYLSRHKATGYEH